MTVKDLTLKFITSPANLEMGAGKLAARFGVTREDIYKAKVEARRLLHAAEVAELQDVVSRQESQLARYIGSETNTEGTTRKYEAARPLTPKEIEDLVGADGVTTTVARVWDKMQPNGIWTYSVDIRYRVKDFYSTDELQEKLKELMPNIQAQSLPVVLTPREECLLILLADDHAGAVNTTNVFGAATPQYSYKEKLLLISQEVKMLGKQFEEVNIISLGDQLNGWNSQTTRGGHEVKSLSNKDQFDIYTEARIAFYNDLFTSGVGKSYSIHEVDNSNHSGNGFSYITNQFLAMYISAKFPTVTLTSYMEAIDGFEYGNHVIIFGHGKDEKFMKKPMPAVLNANTDLLLYDFLSSRRYCPQDVNVTFYKGDLHQLGLQIGKFGRYVNVPAVSGASDYGDLNFGGTKGGALLEILDKVSYRITSQAIWF